MQQWRWIGPLAVAGMALVGSAVAPAAEATAHSRCAGTGSVAHRNLRYARATGAAANLQSLDLYLPTRRPGCAPAPVVVWVHGGGFARGDKANQLADKVRLFTREGWAFASVNYRLAGDPASGPTAGRYPAQPQDLAAALRYLRDHARVYDLSRHRTVLLGHSAGAFLVALVATDTSRLREVGVSPDSVRCTVPLDTEGFDVRDQIAAGGLRERMFRNAFGDEPATWDAASPIRLAADTTPAGDFLMFTRGRVARYQGNVAFRDALRAGGTQAEVIRVDPLTHAQVNEAVGQPGDTLVTPPLMTFLRDCV